MSFSYATPGTGPHAGGIGWFNFGTLTMNPGDNLKNFAGTLRDGTIVTFDMSLVLVSGTGRAFVATQPPTFPGSAFGVNGYTGIVGNVAMYSVPVTPSATSAFTISNIVVKDASGNSIPNYTVVIGDAERTNQRESWVWRTNGGVWKQVAALGTSFPTLTGLGTQTATTTGVGAGTLGSYCLSTQNPTQLVLTTTTTDSTAREGFVIGFATTRVTIQKNISARINPTDQFVLNIAGTPASQNTTSGTATGIQTQTASVYAIPDDAYVLSETMAPGSTSALSQYTQIISSQNASPGGTVPPTGNLPLTFTPALGDNVIYTILNEAPGIYSKTVDKAYANIGEVLTYTVTINNPNNVILSDVQMTDSTPPGTTYVGNLAVSAPYTGTSPESGITVTAIPPNSEVTISWQVKVNTTSSIPNPITNTANITVPGVGSSTTNAAITRVNHARLSVGKEVDRAFTRLGGILTYTISLNNVGNTAADNVVITDTIPAGTTFVPGTVTGASGTPPTLTLTNPVPAGQIANVTFQVQVDNTLPTPNPVSNSASAAYTYTVDPANPDAASGTGNSLPAITQVNTPVITTTKLVDKTNAAPGDVLTYTLSLQNTGNVPANNVVITDTLPSGTAFVVGSLTGATGEPPTLNITDPIDAGDTVVITYKVKVDDSIPSTNPIVNKADTAFTYTVNPTNPNGASGTAPTSSASTQINQAVVSMNKTASPTAVDLNDIITYTLTLQNTGNVSAENVVITDAIPSGTTFVGGSVTGATGTPPTLTLTSPIPPNGSAVVKFQVQVGSTAPDPNTISNTASAAYTYTADPANPNSNTGTAQSNATTTPVNTASISTTKTVDKAFAKPGDTLTYTLTLTNNGNTPANNVVITDAVPTGTTFVTGSVTGATGTPPTMTLANPIPAGGNAVVSFQVLVGTTVPEPNTISNTATTAYTYTVDPANPNGANGTSTSNTADTQVNTADIATAKTVDKTFAKPGDTLTYTLTLKNNGNTPANNVVITDAVPIGTTFVTGSVTGATGTPPTMTLANPIPAGGNAVVSFQVLVGTTVPEPNTISNTATTAYTYTVDPANPNGANGTSTSNTADTQVNTAEIATAKTVDKTFAKPGDTLTYTLTLKNNGNTLANNVVITDAVPTGTTYVVSSLTGATGTPPTMRLTNPIPAGGNAVITFQVLVGNRIPNTNPVSNTAGAAFTYTVDPQQLNSENGTSTSNETNTQINIASIATTKSVDKQYAVPKDVLTYTLTLLNTGNVPANNVVITDAVPSGTVFVPESVTGATGTPPTLRVTGPIGAGETAVVTYQVQVGDIVPNPNPVPNTAKVTFNYTINPTRPNGENGTSTSNTVTTPVNSAAITTTKTVDKEFVKLGDVLTYTLTLQNTGNVPANNVIISDTIPMGTSFVAGSVTGAAGTPPTMTIEDAIQPGSQAVVTFQVKVEDTVPSSSPINNSANVAFTYTFDPQKPNGASGSSESNTVSTQVRYAVVSIVKSVNTALAETNDVLTYTLTLRNTGNMPANNVIISDAVPSGTTFVPDSVIGATGTPPTMALAASIPADGEAVVTFNVRIGDSIPSPNPISSTAGAAYTYTINPKEPNKASGYSDSNTVITLVRSTAMTITKATNKAYATLNDVIIYTVKMNNAGNIPANNVMLMDELPEGTTYIPGSVTGATGYAPVFKLNEPIGAGETATVAYHVRVGNTISTPRTLLNTASAAFTHSVNSLFARETSRSITSNTVITEVQFATVTTTKAVDKAYATTGDVLTYTLTLQNIGNVPANNVVVTDNIPSGTNFIPGTVTGATGALPTLTLTEPISAGGTATVTYQVQVGEDVPTPNPVSNTASTTFTYTIDPAQPDGASGNSASSAVLTQINAPLVTTTKSVDKAFAIPGDVLTYTLTLQNTGNVPANNAVITDALPAGTSFIPGSVTGATGAPPTLNVSSPIGAGETVTVTYQLKVGSSVPNPNPIPNTASTAFTYTIDPAAPNSASGTAPSSIADTQVNAAMLNVLKSADKSVSYLGDIITYKIAVKNSGNVNADNVVITDIIPAGTAYVPGSLTVNVPYTGLLDSGLLLTNPVEPNVTVAIAFQVTVTAIPNPNPMVNTAGAAYSYTVDPSVPDSETAAAVSNRVMTTVFRYNYAQQLSSLIQSVALEEAALANIINAEGAKIQAAAAMGNISTQEMLCLNKSVSETLDSISTLESVLKQKINVVGCQLDGSNSGC